jgi:hypothetical protein
VNAAQCSMQLVVNRFIAFNVLGDWQLIQLVEPS